MYLRSDEGLEQQVPSVRDRCNLCPDQIWSRALGAASSGMDLPPLTLPTPGRFYEIQYGQGGLETTARRAYKTTYASEQVKYAQEINNHPLNRKFWRNPKNAHERKFYPDGIINFNPNFTCDTDQRRAKKGEKRCFARIWIPTNQAPMPEPPRPITPDPVPYIPPSRPRSPVPTTFLPQARFRNLSEARKAVRVALWIDGEASSLLRGPGRTFEWTWEIFKVTIPGKPDRYGFTRLRAGSIRHASPDVKSSLGLRRKLGLSHTDDRVQLVEVGHTHPSGPRARIEVKPEEMSGIHWSRKVCNDGPIPCGDKAWVLENKVALNLITPRGKILVATSRLQRPLGEFSNENKRLWKEENVHVVEVEKGIDKGNEWCPPIHNLKDRVEKRIRELSKERKLSQDELNMALSKLRRQRSKCYR